MSIPSHEPGHRTRFALWLAFAAILLPCAARAAEGVGRGFVDEVRSDGSRVLKAWIRTGAQATAFYSISIDRAGRVASVCTDPSPIPENALKSPLGDMDTVTSWTWTLLSAKGYGRVLVGFWDTEEGTALAAASERGSAPAPCWWRQPVRRPGRIHPGGVNP